MSRKKCEKLGHEWRMWNPSDWEMHCGRFFCRARQDSQMGAFWNSVFKGLGEGRIGTEKVNKG